MKLEEELEMSAPEAAKRLLGSIIEREIDGQTAKVRVVDTMKRMPQVIAIRGDPNVPT
jgi:3-methyladenine DNA glycosylase Mpg